MGLPNKVTKESITGKIKKITYMRVSDSTVTICQLELLNGFSVRGESACIDPLAFDNAMGEKVAFDNAFDKLWQLEGYLLMERRYWSEFSGSLPQAPKIVALFDFGWAIRQLKAGAKVARKGWNGRGMWLSMSGPIPYRSIHADQFWSENNAKYALSTVDQCANVLPCITMKTADGYILMGWLASQTDMLAEDWVLV